MLLFALAWACDSDPDTLQLDVEDTGTEQNTTTTPDLPVEIPVDELADWLALAEYQAWPAEADVHDSTGPHFGDVRTFLSPALAQSLEDGNDQHPMGAATVKELYGTGDVVLGHAVMVRVSDGGGDRAWYWYEDFEGSVFADGRGEGLCSGCHEAGIDFVLTPWPQ